MKKRAKKAEFGYIDSRKKRAIIWSVGILVIAVAIFLTGLFLNKMSKANIFTVFAILCVLPWAKHVVALVVIFPYHSVAKDRFDTVKKRVPSDCQLYTDMVITSSDKVMQLDFVVIGYGQVVALIGKKGQDVAYIRRYLTEGVGNWGDDYRVKIIESEKIFLGEVEGMETKEVDIEEESRVKSYMRSLIV